MDVLHEMASPKKKQKNERTNTFLQGLFCPGLVNGILRANWHASGAVAKVT